jgi:hypothetical protein
MVDEVLKYLSCCVQKSLSLLSGRDIYNVT